MKALLWLLLTFSINVYALDLREYFPANSVVKLNLANGNENTRYTFSSNASSFNTLYSTYLDINRAGYLYYWKKEYKNTTGWCAKTFGIMRMGDDKSVIEVGDWMARGGDGCTPNTVFGYKNFSTNTNTGLIWSPANGLTTTAAIHEMNTVSQNAPGEPYQLNGYQAYSKAGLIKHLPTYTPPYGRDINGNWCAGCSKTYSDVVHIVMYHGTKNATSTNVRCNAPLVADGAYYQSFKNYNSYAIELWIAKDKGIIQENTPFIEDASYWGGAFPNCSGGEFSSDVAWSKYIDEQ
jgi:hypothetical protein